MYKVDLNCDLGEGFGSYEIGNDRSIMKYISSANIACGFHAGDPVIMEKTIQLALENYVAIGAHPGYPDLAGFGRRDMQVAPAEIKALVKYQVSALKGMAEAMGGELQHVKPHGALYNRAASDEKTAEAIAMAIQEIDSEIIFMGLANSEMMKAANKTGLSFASEVFADRAYTAEGVLVPRKMNGAVIHNTEACKKRVLEMVLNSNVMSIDNKEVSIQADTICIHSDNPAALDLAKGIYKILIGNGIKINPLQ